MTKTIDEIVRERKLEDIKETAMLNYGIDFDSLGYKEATKRLVQKTVEDGFIHRSLRAVKMFRDEKLIREIARTALSNELVYDAIVACQLLGDEGGIKRALEISQEKCCGSSYLDLALIGENSEARTLIFDSFHKWASQRGFDEHFSTQYVGNNFSNALILAKDYNDGIAIARGGLFGGYVFDFVGLPVDVVEAKRRGSGASLDWRGVNPIKYEGEKVLVIDDDVYKGRTLCRVAKELKRVNPSKIDVCLTSPRCYSNVDSISHLYDNIFIAEDIRPSNLSEVYQRVVDGLRKGNTS